MSRIRPCCVPGCNDRDFKRHAIVTDKKCREIWLQRINSSKLFKIEDEKTLTSYRVCDLHFEVVCREPSGKLRKFSLPTLNLPGYQKVENDNFLLSSPKFKRSPENIKGRLTALIEINKTISRLTGPVKSVLIPTKVYRKKRPNSSIKDSKLYCPVATELIFEETAPFSDELQANRKIEDDSTAKTNTLNILSSETNHQSIQAEKWSNRCASTSIFSGLESSSKTKPEYNYTVFQPDCDASLSDRDQIKIEIEEIEEIKHVSGPTIDEEMQVGEESDVLLLSQIKSLKSENEELLKRLRMCEEMLSTVFTAEQLKNVHKDLQDENEELRRENESLKSANVELVKNLAKFEGDS